MVRHSLIVLRPERRLRTRGFKDAVREVFEEVVTFERTHARLAWGMTLVGLALGLALQALG
jgi:hypothetical protein